MAAMNHSVPLNSLSHESRGGDIRLEDNVGSDSLHKVEIQKINRPSVEKAMKVNTAAHLPALWTANYPLHVPKYWVGWNVFNQLASKLTELASFSPARQDRSSQKCTAHIVIFQRCNVIPNFAHLTENQLMKIQKETASLAFAEITFLFSNDSCRVRGGYTHTASWC